jgi:preprotein translocase subunit SecD
MKTKLLQRVIIIAVVTLLGLWIVAGPRRTPKLSDFTLAGLNNTLRENIHLGLDLRGGSHLVMQVQVQDYLTRLTNNVAVGIQNAAQVEAEVDVLAQRVVDAGEREVGQPRRAARADDDPERQKRDDRDNNDSL